MGSSKSKDLKTLRETIAEHGREVVTENDLSWDTSEDRCIKAERVLIVLEMVYQKAVTEKSLGAAGQYLDRILGRPKENLSLDNAGSPFNSLSDSDLLSRVVDIINGARERGAEAGS